MSLTPIPSLDDLARDPARARDLPPEVARDLLAQLAPLLTLLLAQAFQGANGQPSEEDGDRLLTVEEVARRLGVSKDAVYRGKWPFEVRPVGRSRRFSAQGLDRFIRQRMGRR